MIVNAYLKVTQKQWEDIKEKYVEPNMYHIVSNSKRKCERCDECSAYNPCTTYEGYCTELEGLVDRNFTCENWHGNSHLLREGEKFYDANNKNIKQGNGIN